MQDVILKICKVFYGFNVICALMMACCLDSESLAPAIVLGVNMLVLATPIIALERRERKETKQNG